MRQLCESARVRQLDGHGVRSGSPRSSRPISLGTLGPKTSRSRRPTRSGDPLASPRSRSAMARLAATVLLPTPPDALREDVAQLSLTLGGGHGDHALDARDPALLRQTALRSRHLRRCAGMWQALSAQNSHQSTLSARAGSHGSGRDSMMRTGELGTCSQPVGGAWTRRRGTQTLCAQSEALGELPGTRMRDANGARPAAQRAR